MNLVEIGLKIFFLSVTCMYVTFDTIFTIASCNRTVAMVVERPPIAFVCRTLVGTHSLMLWYRHITVETRFLQGVTMYYHNTPMALSDSPYVQRYVFNLDIDIYTLSIILSLCSTNYSSSPCFSGSPPWDSRLACEPSVSPSLRQFLSPLLQRPFLYVSVNDTVPMKQCFLIVTHQLPNWPPLRVISAPKTQLNLVQPWLITL